jgi:hypothetical protein
MTVLSSDVTHCSLSTRASINERLRDAWSHDYSSASL